MRRLPSFALVLLAASLSGAMPASAHPGPGPHATEFEQWVPALSVTAGAASRRERWRTTAPLLAPHRFDLLGVRWRGEAARVELRVELRDGRWSRWVQAPPSEQPPAPRTDATQAAGPVWTGGGTRYQLRFSAPIHRARMHFVAVARSRIAPAATPAEGGRPAIVPRSAWDPADACQPRVAPIYGRIDLGFVHHTVSLNGYGPGSSAAMVLGICLFHRNGNGWNDIGYNFLVDRYGTVFEGRDGGIDQPVVGAHAQGWNTTSTGVAAIGDFSGPSAPSAMLRSIARVLAWKLGLSGVPATGTVHEVSIGGELNRWPEKAHVTFQRVSGHRDGGFTDCPGGALYAQLPALRTLVQQSMPAPRDLLTISPVTGPQPQGGPVSLTGRLARADGRRPVGATVMLQQQVAGAWVDVAPVATGADGIWSAALALTQDGAVRAVAVTSGIASPAVAVSVSAGVSARVSSRRPRLGAPIVLSGATTPPKGRVGILVERRVDGGDAAKPRFQRLSLRPIATVAGRYTVAVRLPAVGTYRLSARTPGDRTNVAGNSRRLTVRVLARR